MQVPNEKEERPVETQLGRKSLLEEEKPEGSSGGGSGIWIFQRQGWSLMFKAGDKSLSEAILT